MADKTLTTSEWSKFAKGRDLKDAALVKALGAFEKARKPQDQVETLAAVEKEVDALRKFVKADREFGAQLDAMDKAIAKEEKLAKAAVKEAESEEDEGEEDSPALLTSKLIPLLRELKKGEAEMPVMIAVGSKAAVVLISRRAISPSRRKLLIEQLGESGTPKIINGHCLWEENSYTFVVQAAAAGLAKKLRAAILTQTDLRAKVRVRGEDGVDDEGEAAEQERGESQSEQSQPQPQAQQPTPPSGTIPPAPPLPADALKKKFEERLAALEPRVLAALRAGLGDTGKIRAVAEFARGKGEAAQWQPGLQSLDALEKLLQSGASTDAPTGAGQDPGAAFNARLAALIARAKPLMAGSTGQELKLKLSEAGVFARKKEFGPGNTLLDEVEQLLSAEGGESESEEEEEKGGSRTTAPQGFSKVAFEKLHLDWESGKKSIGARLALLNRAILGDEDRDDDDSDFVSAAAKLNKVLDRFNEGLGDTLDAMRNAAAGPERQRLAQDAGAIADRYLDYLANDELVAHVDENPYDVDVDARALLSAPLQSLRKQLDTLGA